MVDLLLADPTPGVRLIGPTAPLEDPLLALENLLQEGIQKAERVVVTT
jgi:hypothetical protein